jgi:hypothetical protein
MKLFSIFLPVLIAVPGFISPSSFADELVYEAKGEARDIKTGELLYVEHHRRQGNQHHVDYFSPDGKLIVTNRQDFSYSPFVPVIEQTDLRDNERSGLERKNNRWIIYRDNERENISNDYPLVASSGFDAFIRQHWNELSAGKKLDFDFAVPQSLMIAPLRLSRIDCQDADSRIGDENHLCLEVIPSSILFSLFFDPIEVVYDKKDRALMSYRGLTNLNDENGKAYKAEIVYTYTVERVIPKQTALLKKE